MCLKAGNSWFWRDFILANWESDCGKVGVALLAWPFKTTSKEKCTCIELGSDGALKPPLASSSQAKPLPYTRRNERTRLCCVQVVVVAEAAQQRKTTVEPKIFLKLTWWIPRLYPTATTISTMFDMQEEEGALECDRSDNYWVEVIQIWVELSWILSTVVYISVGSGPDKPENPKRSFEMKPDKPEPELCKNLQTRSNPNPNFKPAGTLKT